MKQQKKQPKGKAQSNQAQARKQAPQQQNQDFELRIKKIQKQIASLNLDVEYLLEEKKFKDNTHKTLLKQRKKLQNCFLFKNMLRPNKIENESTQKESEKINQPKNIVKNQFRDVNQKIVKYIEQLQASKKNQNTSYVQNRSHQEQVQSQQPNRKLECQSLHLKQIFNPQQTLNHETKTCKLQSKLSLLYQKISLNLQREEPYLHEKILQRIKRQAQSYTRKKLFTQIDKLIKENSVWMTQENNRVNNLLEQQKVEETCKNNLGLMKKIMMKKVANNDWIFDNYSNNNFINESTSAFPVLKIAKQYQEVLKQLQQNRIADQLNLVRNTNLSYREQNIKYSLKQIFSDETTQQFMFQQGNSHEQLKKNEQNLLTKVQTIYKEIQKLTKH